MSRKSLQEAFDEGFEAVKKYIDAELNDIRSRVKALEDGEKPRVRVQAGSNRS